MSFAIIKTGGKQYKVAAGQKLKVEKLDQKVGETVVFDEVLLTDDGQATKVGAPLLAGVKVSGKVSVQGRSPKVTIIKFKNKTRIRNKRGHRQPFTEVTIGEIK